MGNQHNSIAAERDENKALVLKVLDGLASWNADIKPWVKKLVAILSLFITLFLSLLLTITYVFPIQENVKLALSTIVQEELNHHTKEIKNQTELLETNFRALIESENRQSSLTIQDDISEHITELRRLNKAIGDLYFLHYLNDQIDWNHKEKEWSRINTKVYVTKLRTNQASQSLKESLQSKGFDVQIRQLFKGNSAGELVSEEPADFDSDSILGIGLSQYISKRDACTLINETRKKYKKLSFIVSGTCATNGQNPYISVIGLPAKYQKLGDSQLINKDDFETLCKENSPIELFYHRLQEYSPSYNIDFPNPECDEHPSQ